jgi:translation initiation factor IF-3
MAKQFFKKPTPGAGGPPKPNARQNRWSREMPVKNAGVRMNEQIRVPEIRVVDEDGVVGVMSPQDAMRLANERGVDLIEIAPNAQPPVCKLMEFGKWRYEQQKRDRVAKATQFKQLTKEARFHPSTDTHDFDFKLRHAREWIEEGHKVKATVQFKGRQIAYKEFGEKLLKRFADALSDIAKPEGNPSLAGKLMTMMFSPKGKKSDDKKDDAPEEKVERGPSELGLQLKKKLDV